MALRFASFDPGEHGYSTLTDQQVAAELAKKTLGGLQTCRTVVTLHQEAIDLLRNFAERAQDIDLRVQSAIAPSIMSATGEMSGFLSVFNTLQLFFRTWGNAASQLITTLENDTLAPFETLIAQLTDEKQQFLVQKKQETATTRDTASAEVSGNQALPTLSDQQETRLFSARAELQEALKEEASLQARFGSGCRPELLLTMQDKIKIAQENLRNQEMLVTKSTTLQFSDPSCLVSTISSHHKAPYRMRPGYFSLMDVWEHKRLEGLKRVFLTTSQGFKQFQVSTSRWIGQLDAGAQYFDVKQDVQMWLEQLKMPEKGDQRTTNKSDLERSSDHKPIRSPSTYKTSSKTQRDNLEPLVQTSKSPVASAFQDKENAFATPPIDKSLFSGGDQGELHQKEGRLSIGTALERSRIDEKDAQLSRTVCPPSQESISRRSTYGANGDSAEVDVTQSKSSLNDLKDAAPSTINNDDEAPERTNTTDIEPMISHSFSRAQLNQCFPDLCTHLSRPIEQCSGADVAEYFVEIQRRFEEYLLSLRQLNLSSYVRGKTWDDSLYYRGPDIEDGFRFYPIKLPAGTSMDFTRESYFGALEWGAPRLNDLQWGCIAYETLLLALAYLTYKNAMHEVEELPLRDIRNAVSTRKRAGRESVRRENLDADGVLEDKSPRQRETFQVQSAVRKAAATGGGVPRLVEPSGLNDALSEENVNIVKKLVTLMRLKLCLAGSTNLLIVELTVPSGGEWGRMGQWVGLHPLDVRYRVARLLDSWVYAGFTRSNGPPLREQSVFCEWVIRQLHVAHTALTFKIWRFARFLPSNKPLFQLLNGWPRDGPWFRPVHQFFDRFPEGLSQDLLTKLTSLSRLFQIAFAVLAALVTAVEERQWGVETVSHRSKGSLYRNAEWISRLVGIMGNIASLDKQIRSFIIEDETAGEQGQKSRKMTRSSTEHDLSYTRRSTESLKKHLVTNWSEGTGSDHVDRQRLREPETQVFQNIALFQAPPSKSLDIYWGLDVPILQLIMSYLWRTVADVSTADALHADSPLLAAGLLLVSHVIQLGWDPTPCIGTYPLPSPIVTLSAETHCLLLAQALWKELFLDNDIVIKEELNDAADPLRTQETDVRSLSGTKADLRLKVIPTRALETLLRLADVEQFVEWLREGSAACSKETGRSTVIQSKRVVGLYPPSGTRLWCSPTLVALQRFGRLVNQWHFDPWDALCAPRRWSVARSVVLENRGFDGHRNPKRTLSDNSDPDFHVIDVTSLKDLDTRQRKNEQRKRVLEEQLVFNEDHETEDNGVLLKATEHWRRGPPAADRSSSDVEEGPEDVLNKEARKKKRADALLRDLGFARKKRIGTAELQSDIYALDFNDPAEFDDVFGTKTQPHVNTPFAAKNLIFQSLYPSSFCERKLERNLTDDEALKSRVRVGYDVLHNAGMALTTEQYLLLSPLETIRERPEGISLLLPSRIERVMSEVLCNRLITAAFRGEMADALGNYRLQLEPDALPLLLKIWNRVHHGLSSETLHTPPELPNLSHFHMRFVLTESLKGPSPEYDLYRYFIRQTMVHLLSRLFTETRLALTEPPSKPPQHMETDALATTALPTTSTYKAVELFGAALEAFLEELRGELQFYPEYWKDVLPSNQHALIAIYTSRKHLAGLLNELLASPYWPADDVPPFGAKVLKGIRVFERLAHDVQFGTRLTLSSDPDLLSSFKLSVQGALQKQCHAMETTLQRCITTDTWEPVAGQLHSNAVVDLFSFIHHFILILLDLYAPFDWVIPLFVGFLDRVAEMFTSHILSDCFCDGLCVVQQECEAVFDTLHTPAERRGAVSQKKTVNAVASLTHSKKGHSKGLFKTVRRLAGFGKPSQSTQPTDRYQATALTPLPLPKSPEASDVEVPTASNLHYVKSTSETTIGGVSEDQRSVRSLSQTKKKSRKKKKSKEQKNPSMNDDLTVIIPEPSFTRIATRFGVAVVLNYCEIKKWFLEVPLTSCLVRFHNLKMFLNQLPTVTSKCREVIVASIRQRDPKAHDIIRALHLADGRTNNVDDQVSDALDCDEDKLLIESLDDMLKKAIEMYRKKLENTATELCRLAALRIVVFEFGDDFFEELYHPTFERYTFECILTAFKDTAERFIVKVPEEYQSMLRTMIVEYLVKVWCYLITEMGCHGTIFLPEDLAVLDEDLEALKSFFERQFEHPLPLFLTLGVPGSLSSSRAEKTDVANRRVVQLFDYVNDFFCYLGYHPDALAKLGATDLSTVSYSPTEKRQSNANSDVAQPSSTASGSPLPSTKKLLFREQLSPPRGAHDFEQAFGSNDGREKKKKKKKWFQQLF